MDRYLVTSDMILTGCDPTSEWRILASQSQHQAAGVFDGGWGASRASNTLSNNRVFSNTEVEVGKYPAQCIVMTSLAAMRATLLYLFYMLKPS